MSIARTYETYTYGGHPAFRDNDSLRRHLNPSANIMPRTDVKRIRPSSQESTGDNTGPDAVPIEIGDVVVEVTEVTCAEGCSPRVPTAGRRGRLTPWRTVHYRYT